MVDKPKDSKIKAIRSGIEINPDVKPEPNQNVIDVLERMLALAKEGDIQQLVLGASGDGTSSFGLYGGTIQYILEVGYQLRALTLMYEDIAFAPVYDALYGDER